MKPKTRILSFLLALVLTLSLLPAPLALAAGTGTYNGASYSTDYTTWRQGAAPWGSTALGDVHTFGGSGCLISAIAMLMCHSKAYDPAAMNPGVLRDWLDAQGYISHSSDRSKDALLSFGRITASTSPRFYFVNQTFFPVDTPLSDVIDNIAALRNNGYYVVARVKNSGHFVGIRDLTADGDARILDSGYVSKSLLSEYNGTIGGLICFKANLSGKDTILPNVPTVAAPGAPSVTKLSTTYGDGDKIPVSWKAASLATHYNLYIDRKVNGSWKANYKTAFYVTSPYTVDPLPAGEYRLRIQAANSKTKPWTYTNSDYQSFSVKAGYLTVTYNADGGTVSPATQFVKAGSKYALPTPTKSKSAFLGWYTAGGKMVNLSSTVGTKGHTLTAKWSSTGVGFKKTATYKNQFKDVSSKAWYYSAVSSAYAYGLMNGTEKTKFKPNDQITNAQAITLAARMRKLYLTGSGSFTATKPWHKAYSDYAVSQKIIASVPKDMNAKLTRQEFAAILAQTLPSAALPQINSVAAGSIPDVYRSDTAIYSLYRAGIFSGNDAKGTFRPNAPISRAEVAAVLMRMADPNARVLFTLK